MLLSIIIPAYNAERYLAACLDSCLAQRPFLADGMEIIVVDDGSTDGTPALLADYAALHDCLRVLHQSNQGQSVARNLAIEAAQGDYLYMVDGDDRMLTADDACVLPLDAMRSQRFDIIGLQVAYQPEQGPRRPWSHQMENWPFGQEYEQAADFVRSHNIEGLVYGYVFRRALFVAHPELRFTPGIYHQDEELIFKIFTLAGRTVYLRGYTYLYYEHTGSSLNTRTEQRRRKLLDDHVTILRRLVDWRERFGPTDARTSALRTVMHFKLAYLSMDLLRILIRQQVEAGYLGQTLNTLQQLGLYPLPALSDRKYSVVRLLTCHPRLVGWWARHRALSRRIGF